MNQKDANFINNYSIDGQNESSVLYTIQTPVVTISIYTQYTVISLREEAAGYVQEQTKWDSRRGLKRSWTASPEEGPSAGARPTAEEKGQ